jgi:hypothetical protein
MKSILSDPRKLNLVFAAVLLAVGLAIYWIWHPRRFTEHSFLERAFEFWVLKWMLFSVTYGLLTANTDARFVLASVDLNSIMGIGFAFALWKGDSYDERRTLMNLIFLFGLLISWNFVGHPLTSPRVWIMPSMTVAFVALLAMGAVVLARYGMIAIAFLAVSIAYVLLQMPGYHVLFVGGGNSDQELVKWLAFGKVLYGVTFYPIFFSPITNFVPLPFPRFPGLGMRMSKALNWALGAIGAGLLAEGALWVGKLLWRKMTGHSIP